jgi:hypothetical protein
MLTPPLVDLHSGKATKNRRSLLKGIHHHVLPIIVVPEMENHT